ncbi:PPOX class F420-dependent oxidoreductase [Nakamurella aerolata]|uniref:PPOX class F420-dependent oxidoreductase n=1 Tax=Nakamurella aerolata TaxID=1656892 RepID=A0A849AE84_9ACTN|nr:PPOX class F420-dependent oxidoreductase [Nakamurella aerolata]NNG36770.1 PPOX class F420-dependent oxidoreductase [Nakamurella aerolata]
MSDSVSGALSAAVPKASDTDGFAGFTEPELHYLRGNRLGRLATLRPDGTLQNSPVGYFLNDDGSIDIRGRAMSSTQKYRNVAATGQIALVIDDVASVQPWRVRCVEIRGTAEAIADQHRPGGVGDGAVIRVFPRRVISFGLDPVVSESATA